MFYTKDSEKSDDFLEDIIESVLCGTNIDVNVFDFSHLRKTNVSLSMFMTDMIQDLNLSLSVTLERTLHVFMSHTHTHV